MGDPKDFFTYHNTLCDFMEYRNKAIYPSNKTFTQMELLQIQPEDIYKWFAYRAYGTETPGEEDTPFLRVASLAYSKKAISFWMPNNNQPWSIDSSTGKGSGNPTRSKLVNGLIKAMGALEGKGVGAKSQKDRGLTVGLGDNRLTPDGTNPIERIGVYPSEVNGNVSLDQVEDEEGQDGSARARTAAQWRVSIYARTASMSRSVTEIQNQHRSDMMEIKRRLRKLEQMVHTLVSRPATPYPTAAGMLRGPALLVRPGVPPPTKPALLSRNPRTLSLLWDEWQVGLNGHKPASQFTDSERGGENKNRYTFRKPFWRCMCRLIRNGLDKATAIQRIEQTYGVMSLTKTLRAMRQHEGPNKDGHHALRV